MTVETQDPIVGLPISDQVGGMTPELVELLQRLVDAIADHEARIAALEP